jgi:transposase
MRRKPYQQYSREFKREAIRLVEVGDKTASQVARELGIRVNQMWKWRQQLEREAAVGAVKRGRPADDELARVRRENARLKEENEILKKAATYFARESR